jgi:hypothetical protein
MSEQIDAVNEEMKALEAGKLLAVGAKATQMFRELWRVNAVDIQRKLVEVVEEAQLSKKGVKFAVPLKVVLDLEKDEVSVTMGWSGPKKKRGYKTALSEIEPMLPGMEEEE